mgnify:CR=1 FL=1
MIAVLFTNHWLLLADEESKSPTFCVMTGFGGFGVTDKVMALVVIVTGDTHFALDDSIQLITSPFAGVANVMEVSPPEPGIITPFLYQLITGDKPGLEFVSVKTAASPEHNEVLGVAMDAVCVIFGETRTVIAFELTVAGVAQLALLVSLQDGSDAERVKAIIVTKGADGSEIHTVGKCVTIPGVRADKVVDPTGCGDAYRGGLLYGIAKGLDWETTGCIASLMGAIKIGHHGTQNHRFTREEFAARFKREFGCEFA